MTHTEKEGRMSKVRVLVLASLVAALAGLLVTGGAAGRQAKCGSLTMDENAWAGATANVYVVKYVLEKNYGCKVNVAKLPESTPLFQAMTDGKVDVVLEDWNNIQLKVNTHFVTKEKSVIDLKGSRRDRAHRVVHPDVPDEAAPRVRDVEGTEGQGVALQEPGVRLAGDVPRR